MARNEEKQYGRLNRLWLQKEKEEGRIKDVHARPKLSTLNSVAAVRKWIPSIKDEMEYCLQQSQLSHYPERKIAEFKLHIEVLEKEYKRFLNKLRALDPTHKHHPWKPRAYAKRRCEAPDGSSGKRLCTPETASSSSSSSSSSMAVAAPAASEMDMTTQIHDTHSGSAVVHQPSTTSAIRVPPSHDEQDQDQDRPLAFNRTRLAVATAGCRGPVAGTPRETTGLSEALFSGLPNLQSSPLAQAQAQARALSKSGGQKEELGKAEGPTNSQPVNSTQPAPQSTADVLGLGCYSSSDDDEDS